MRLKTGSPSRPPPWRFHPITERDRMASPEQRATTRLHGVPVLLRVLAGLLALAALFAAVSLISTAARGNGDLRALLLGSVQVIVDICLGALFAYVAVTGLAPTHLVRSAGDAWTGRAPRFRLEPAMQRYIRQLNVQQPQITECWILGQVKKAHGCPGRCRSAGYWCSARRYWPMPCAATGACAGARCACSWRISIPARSVPRGAGPIRGPWRGGSGVRQRRDCPFRATGGCRRADGGFG